MKPQATLRFATIFGFNLAALLHAACVIYSLLPVSPHRKKLSWQQFSRTRAG